MFKTQSSNYIGRLKKRKEEALEFVIDQYLGLVKGCVTKVLTAMGEEDREECINDVFLAIWEHADQFNGEEVDFKKWVYRIAKYKAIDYYRKFAKTQGKVIPFCEEEHLEEAYQGGQQGPLIVAFQTSSVENVVLDKEQKEEVLELIRTLEPLDQQIFILKYFLEMKSVEIGRQLHLSQTAVDNRLYRGKKKLDKRVANA